MIVTPLVPPVVRGMVVEKPYTFTNFLFRVKSAHKPAPTSIRIVGKIFASV